MRFAAAPVWETSHLPAFFLIEGDPARPSAPNPGPPPMIRHIPAHAHPSWGASNSNYHTFVSRPARPWDIVTMRNQTRA